MITKENITQDEFACPHCMDATLYSSACKAKRDCSKATNYGSARVAMAHLQEKPSTSKDRTKMSRLIKAHFHTTAISSLQNKPMVYVC